MGDSGNIFADIGSVLTSAGNRIGGDIGRTVKDVVKNPLALTGILGTQLSIAKSNLIDQPKERMEDQARMQADQVGAVKAQIAEADAKSALTKKRDEERAKQRAQGLGAQGRAGTILTGPLGQVGGDPANNKTILGG